TIGQKVYAFVDDHNGSDVDPGSSFTFAVTRCVREREPNDSPAQASPLACGIEGSISPESDQSDQDFYGLGLFPAGWRLFVLVDGEAAGNADFDLRITTATDTLQYNNKDNDTPFGDSSPNIAGTPLTESPAFIRVDYNYFNPKVSSEPYRVYAVVQPPLEQAVPETEPNNSVLQANSVSQNYFLGTLSGPAPSSDVDVYAFSGAEGDLIFLSLDGDPYRTNAPVNAQLELLDAAGNTLVVVNDGAFRSNTNASCNTLTGLLPFSPGEALVYRSAVEGPFYARVSASPTAAGNTAAGAYLLSIAKNCRIGSSGLNHPPVFTNLVLTSLLTAGSQARLSGTIWDPDSGDSLSLAVDWGDGVTNHVDYPWPGLVDFSLTHLLSAANPNLTATLTVRDAHGGSGTATVHVGPKPLAPRLTSITVLSKYRIHLQLQGTPRAVYRVEKSDTLGSWSILGTSTADASGLFALDDVSPCAASRFYRAVAVE
ncbi:MAG TPA: hypothetical protein VEO53_18495, partial [Candidatus Binatia bacterium]|nr:hypothetical protein [Candidatus Binatia bacterium]